MDGGARAADRGDGLEVGKAVEPLKAGRVEVAVGRPRAGLEAAAEILACTSSNLLDDWCALVEGPELEDEAVDVAEEDAVGLLAVSVLAAGGVVEYQVRDTYDTRERSAVRNDGNTFIAVEQLRKKEGTRSSPRTRSVRGCSVFDGRFAVSPAVE